jgi:hypothetical protein
MRIHIFDILDQQLSPQAASSAYTSHNELLRAPA